MGKVPTISINKTDGCHVYLSKNSLDCEIVSAKSSEMNVLIPTEGDDFVSSLISLVVWSEIRRDWRLALEEVFQRSWWTLRAKWVQPSSAHLRHTDAWGSPTKQTPEGGWFLPFLGRADAQGCQKGMGLNHSTLLSWCHEAIHSPVYAPEV